MKIQNLKAEWDYYKEIIKFLNKWKDILKDLVKNWNFIKTESKKYKRKGNRNYV